VAGDDFPLIIKLIDARDKLSVQVHPNDDNAAAVDGDAKTEMWYFLKGDPDAQIYCGLKPGIGNGNWGQSKIKLSLFATLKVAPSSSLLLVCR
jgi:mannose-6-phosphate isomerase class I